MPKITKIHAREVLDSRGTPTVEVEMHSVEGEIEIAIVPSGASTGSHEAIELRDDDNNRYMGKGVLKAAENVNKIIAPIIIGLDAFEQQKIDHKMLELDGTENKGRLGANGILAVSMAAMRLSAKIEGMHLFERVKEVAKYQLGEKNSPTGTLLPTPMMNIINGGMHADSGLEIQEFMIMPVGAINFHEALQIGAEIFQNLKKILKSRNLIVSVGDEGGFAPRLNSNEEALRTIMEAITASGHKDKVKLAMDIAASEFYKDGKYEINGKKLSSAEIVDFYQELIEKYPIISIEDGCHEEDWAGWQLLTERLGKKIQLVGDDLFVTNKKRLQMGIDKKAANSILIKLNQIGTITETIETMQLANQHNMNSIVSHRSGETEDTTIADFAVGMSCGQIKTGSLCRTDRIAKYNQLLRIEERLGEKAVYAGNMAFKNLSKQ